MAYVSQDDKAKLAPAIKKVLNKYGMKGSISIRHHSTLVVNLQSGGIQFEHSHGDGYTQVNVYHIESHYEGHAKAFLLELLAAMKGPSYFNNDDAMTDYFHRSHYTDINIGKWNKPYFLQDLHKPKKAKVAKKTSKKLLEAPVSDSVEAIARMTLTQREKLVSDLVSRYPNLADDLMSAIGFGLLENEVQA